MKTKLFQNNIIAKKSTIHGYGVFAGKDLKKGEMIEECHFVFSHCKDKVIFDFIFDVKGRLALLFGYGSLYNHSDKPNADYDFNIKSRIATFKADRVIKKGEEIFISYGDEWFGSRNRKKKAPRKQKI